jgi:hypothetical protein
MDKQTTPAGSAGLYSAGPADRLPTMRIVPVHRAHAFVTGGACNRMHAAIGCYDINGRAESDSLANASMAMGGPLDAPEWLAVPIDAFGGCMAIFNRDRP